MIDESHGVVQSTAGTAYFVRVLSTLDREKLKANASVALHRHSHAVVEILPPEADSTIQAMEVQKKPDITYADIGGLDMQKQEIREAVELPLSNPELYSQVRRARWRGAGAARAGSAAAPHPTSAPPHPLPPDRHRPAARRADVRPAGHGQDDDGQGGGQRHVRRLYRRRRL
jgi:hypothetical protein